MTEDSSEMHVNRVLNRSHVLAILSHVLRGISWVSQGVATAWSGQCKVVSFYCRIYFVQHLIREKQANYSDLVVIFVQHEFNGAAVVPIYLQCDFAALRIVANHRHIY